MTGARTDKKFYFYAGLVLGTLALYWPVSHSPFTLFDDVDLISANPHINSGFSWANLLWAFQDIHSGNWLPLTWITHMLDCQLFGLNAGAHHLTSVGIHIANAVLLFEFLRYTTGAHWRSAMVAALFAWHPLHVESVAWAAERKDVLSAFFFFLTLLAYARYTQSGHTWQETSDKNSQTAMGNRHALLFYGLALIFFALGLMSKPMVVTLPFVLVLLDVWPLGRIPNKDGSRHPLKKLLVEKIPFFFLSFALCAMTFLAQRGAGAVIHIAWSSRLSNVPVAYVRYLSKTFWPADLAIYYPYVYDWSAATIAGCTLLLLLVSGLALGQIRQRAWLMAGWFWFLGTLFPVIGIVQAGMQSMADRYTYLPSIGLFIVIVWGVYDFSLRQPELRKHLPLVSGAALTGCLIATSVQLSYWQNNVKLFLHTVETTTDNYVALNSLGSALREIGREEDAIKVFRESIRIEPFYWPSQRNLALALLANRQPDEAFKQFEVVLQQLPADASLRYEISLYLLHYKRVEAAKRQLAAALQLDPAYRDAHELLGAIYLQQSNLDDAIPQFYAVLKINPQDAEAQLNLGLAMEKQGKFHDAVLHLREAARLAPGAREIKKTLQQILAAHPESDRSAVPAPNL